MACSLDWASVIVTAGRPAVLALGVALDVALGGVDRPVPGQQLHVAPAAPGAIYVFGGGGDEGASPRMRRAAVELK